ncbi:MAG TPA: DUF547 domain-containing protein [Thermoanaerobaculia bacterium]|jgi:hypothetical protein
MKNTGTNLVLLLLALLAVLAGPAGAAVPPDYRAWGELLAKYYDPAQGMNYKALKAQDKQTLDELRRRLATADIQTLSRQDQLAYWINLYNISVVGIVVDNYPVESIRDLSTDPLIRLNIFKKDLVDTKRGKVSLNDIENEKIRDGFKDPRIHFAINCAAKSCPPIRPEPYVGSRVSEQLDDQARKFLNGPMGVRVEKKGGGIVLYTTKVMDWFADDFAKWGGGQIAFIVRYVNSDKRKPIDAAGNQVDLKFYDYDWKLNDNSG